VGALAIASCQLLVHGPPPPPPAPQHQHDALPGPVLSLKGALLISYGLRLRLTDYGGLGIFL
jgi:hypothetical protein